MSSQQQGRSRKVRGSATTGRGPREEQGGSGTRRRRDAQGRQRNRRPQDQRRFSQQAPSQRGREADPARLAAFEVLQAVAEQDAYANLVLPAAIRRHRLDRRDAGFATELAYGALRMQGLHEQVLSRCVDRSLQTVDQKIRSALLLGVHQLLGMRVPDHAAIDQTVSLARAVIGMGPSTLVNAVLRRVAEHDREEWIHTLGEEAKDDVARWGIEHSHPAWIVRAFRQALAAHGRVPTEIEELLEADNVSPVVHLVALPGLGDLTEARDQGAEPMGLVPDALTYAQGDLGRLASVREGSVRAQDAGSQLVARALAAAPLDGADAAWLDLCAGPGGKAALLGAVAQQRGAQLVANELAPHRAELVRASLKPLQQEGYAVLVGDGRRIRERLLEAEELPEQVALAVEAFGASGEIFDRVMVDAPCTGLGALRRRPEARWRRTPADLAELIELQEQLLRAAISVTRPGGVIAYVTCSPHPAETQNVLLDVLDGGEVQLLDTAAAVEAAAVEGALRGDHAPGHELPGAAAVPGQRRATTVQLWPHVHGTDAMFLALLQRR